ncbi:MULTISPECIES: MerR family transcriptional regulator [Streptomonospora]|uniref:MerR family transcriptional regulator n=2 Tax=Streptomonospora TaxID=104204 RepID=A0ABV9SHT2_9ACTN
MTADGRPGPDRALYTISVAADLAGIAPQSLRLYEQRGLLSPARTDGGTRLYSDNDIARLRRIAELAEEGVNLAGIARILDLQEENTRLRGAGGGAG